MLYPYEDLPPFTPAGLLPAGDYPLTLADLRASCLVTGEGVGSDTWDFPWREWLVNSLGILARQLWTIGIGSIYIDGSFVEEKDHPNDIDRYFDCPLMLLASGQLQASLNALDGHGIWTWDPHSRTFDADSGKAQLPMWWRYRVELYPHVGMPSGILDRYGNPMQFPAAFRVRRSTYERKGIIRLVRET